MNTLTDVDRANLRVRIMQRKIYIERVIAFINAIIGDSPTTSRWHEGFCFERETNSNMLERAVTDYTRYSVYVTNPWSMIFSVHVPVSPSTGSSAINETIVICLEENESQGQLRSVIANGIGDESYDDTKLLRDAKRFGIEVPAKLPNK